MTKLRKPVAAALATIIVGGSALTLHDSAWARPFKSEMPRMESGQRHHGGGFRRHHGGGLGGFGTGLAIGLGVQMLGHALANRDEAWDVEHKRIHQDAGKQGWTARNERRHACYVAEQYRKLLKSAEDLLKRMKNSGSSQDVLDLQQKDVDHRRAELKRALAQC